MLTPGVLSAGSCAEQEAETREGNVMHVHMAHLLGVTPKWLLLADPA